VVAARVQAPVEHRGDVTGVGEASAGGGGVDQDAGRVLAVEDQQGEVGTQRRVGLASGQALDDAVRGGVDLGQTLDAETVLGRRGERVVVPLGDRCSRLVGSASRCSAVAAETGASSRCSARARMSPAVGGKCVAGDDAVRVAVAGCGEVEVVGVAAAGHRHVQQLTGFLAVPTVMAGVGGDALGAVHGGGVAECDVAADIPGGQGHYAAGAQVRDLHRTGLEVVLTRHRSPFLTQSVLVMAILRSLTRLMMVSPAEACGAVDEAYLSPCVDRADGDPVGVGTPIEFGDERAGGGEHDRVAAAGTVG
jgi:hypothetical protein